jgi:membrane associated rhomboid family serine protease
MAIFVFGSLIERPLGSAATVFVMALSGVCAIVGASAAGLVSVLGAWCIASGIVGVLLWLEFRHGDDLPASWRVPRRLFVTLVVLEHVMLLPVPFVAVSGHLGGTAWGLMLRGAAIEFAEAAPWMAIFPGVAISLAVFAFNLLGDSLRDALDPRLRTQ